MPNLTKPVIFFDGVCAVCNGFVDWIIRRDHDRKFMFAPIQGETFAATGRVLGDDAAEWKIVYQDAKGEYSEASTAVLNILRDLGGGWRLFSGLRIIPAVIRNAVYSFIARHRYKWFGKREKCRIPTPEERAQFLP